MDNGYVLLHRKMCSNKLWLSEKFTKAQAWIDLFLNANHKEGSFWVRGNEIKIKRGQIGWSELNMAQRWRWSRNKVRMFLFGLEKEQQIRQQKTFITTVITILNYDSYQEWDSRKDTKQNSRQNSRKTAEGTQTKNVKEELKNENETYSDVPSQDVVQIIDSFKEVNPSYRKWYSNTSQRGAIERMLSIHGIERLKQVIAFLPKSNTLPYIPTITSPYVLEERWADLEAGMKKLKNKQITNRPNVIFS